MWPGLEAQDAHEQDHRTGETRTIRRITRTASAPGVRCSGRAQLKDSGNDLIAVRGDAMRAIQVKATKIEDDGYRVRGGLPEHYHALAIVKFEGSEGTLYVSVRCVPSLVSTKS